MTDGIWCLIALLLIAPMNDLQAWRERHYGLPKEPGEDIPE